MTRFVVAEADVPAIAARQFTYDADTGLFWWKATKRAGRIAGRSHSAGYWTLFIRGRQVYAHRLAWFFCKGAWPKGHLDHINGDRLDNRIGNLREVSATVNSQNQRTAHVDSKSGLLGIYRHRGLKKRPWISCIRVNGKRMSLGAFETAEQAHRAYLEAKRTLHLGCTV